MELSSKHRERNGNERQTDRQKENERQTFFTSFAKDFGRRKGMLTTNLKTWGFAGLCLLCLRCAFSCVPIAASVRHDKYPIVKRTDNGLGSPSHSTKNYQPTFFKEDIIFRSFFGASHMCLPACLRFESPQDCTAMMNSL
jgi:hypothetical protein